MDIATAYVQIIPSTEGIESNLTSALTGAGDTAASLPVSLPVESLPAHSEQPRRLAWARLA